MNKMKTFLTLFVLLFSSSVVADGISDFEIEGMSIGDSLLDYFSEKEIKNNIKNYYSKYNGEFIAVEFWKLSFFEKYESIQITFKKNDNNYKIYGITGSIYFDDINDCYDLQNKVSKEISNIFINAVKNIESGAHSADPSGKSYVNGIFFDYPSGDYAQVSCYDWSDEHGGDDHLRIGMISNEFFYWLQYGEN